MIVLQKIPWTVLKTFYYGLHQVLFLDCQLFFQDYFVKELSNKFR